jgi:hypothetical protein
MEGNHESCNKFPPLDDSNFELRNVYFEKRCKNIKKMHKFLLGGFFQFSRWTVSGLKKWLMWNLMMLTPHTT